MLPKDGQQFSNEISETSIAFGSITNAYATLKDLGLLKKYNHISVQSTLDNPITLRFNEVSEITLANETFVLDGFVHDGIIAIKYNASAPSSGSLKMRSW